MFYLLSSHRLNTIEKYLQFIDLKEVFSILYRKIHLTFSTLNRKVAYDVIHLARKKVAAKSCNLCWKSAGQTLTFGVILKTNKKLIKNWNELLLVCYSETNKFNQKRFG